MLCIFGTGMIMGGSVSTVYYNLKLKHPTLDMPLIDYDLALLMQPMLMLGVSMGVIFNVIFPNWLITALLIILFLGAFLIPTPSKKDYLAANYILTLVCIYLRFLLTGTSTKAYLKGIETWKKETIQKRVMFGTHFTVPPLILEQSCFSSFHVSLCLLYVVLLMELLL